MVNVMNLKSRAGRKGEWLDVLLLKISAAQLLGRQLCCWTTSNIVPLVCQSLASWSQDCFIVLTSVLWKVWYLVSKKSWSHKKSWIQLSSDFLCLDKKIVQMVHEKHHYVCCRVQNLLNFQQHLEAYQIIQHNNKKVHALRGVVFGVLCLWEAGQWHWS